MGPGDPGYGVSMALQGGDGPVEVNGSEVGEAERVTLVGIGQLNGGSQAGDRAGHRALVGVALPDDRELELGRGNADHRHG